MTDPKDEFLRLLSDAVGGDAFVKLTLGRYRGADATLRNLYVRPVTLRAGPHLSFTWRHTTRDITKNHPPVEAVAALARLVGADFHSAHLFTTTADAQLEFHPDRPPRLKLLTHAATTPPSRDHDFRKARPIAPSHRWLSRLGVTTTAGAVRAGMGDKLRQINRFVELLAPLVRDASLPEDRPVEVVDMGCGKGYLTFAFWQHLHDAGRPAHVCGIEQRPGLVDPGNGTARDCGCTGLEFAAGTIADTPLPRVDILIALHACNTATDDAIARGIAAGAGLIVVAPCCHQELSPLLTAPEVLAPALRQGIFHERQAEFVTDALRTLLLEWAGYDTRAFEFIATEHTAKNLMIAAVRHRQTHDREAAAVRVRELAAFYGIRRQALAARLDFPLVS